MLLSGLGSRAADARCALPSGVGIYMCVPRRVDTHKHICVAETPRCSATTSERTLSSNHNASLANGNERIVVIASVVHENDVVVSDLGVASTTRAHRCDRNGHAARRTGLRREFQPGWVTGGQDKNGVPRSEGEGLALDLPAVVTLTTGLRSGPIPSDAKSELTSSLLAHGTSAVAAEPPLQVGCVQSCVHRVCHQLTYVDLVRVSLSARAAPAHASRGIWLP